MGPCESMAQGKAGIEGQKTRGWWWEWDCQHMLLINREKHGDNQGWALITDILTVQCSLCGCVIIYMLRVIRWRRYPWLHCSAVEIFFFPFFLSFWNRWWSPSWRCQCLTHSTVRGNSSICLCFSSLCSPFCLLVAVCCFLWSLLPSLYCFI